MNRIALYVNTIRYLKVTQIRSRILKKIKPKWKYSKIDVPESRNISLIIPELDFLDSFRHRFDSKEMLSGKIKLLNNYYKLSYEKENKELMTPLCWYNLQYFEFAIALGVEYQESDNKEYYRVFKSSFYDYLKQNIDLEPYVVSLQIPNLLIAMELFENEIDIEFERELRERLYIGYLFLQKNLETHILGNHYLENLKSLVIASYYFMEDDKCANFLGMCRRELEEEILPDGMHFELSPMYHKIILEDLLRIAILSKNDDFPKCFWIKDTIQKMINAMYFLENGFTRTPLFNDAGDNVAKPWSQYVKASTRLLNIVPQECISLPNAGYYRLDNESVSILIDAGPVGPSYIPGHGHCDCLSFEMEINGNLVFVNSGTLLYQGKLRKYFRSTGAHNTIIMDGHEQSECWGEHRVAKRISDIKAVFTDNYFEGEYKNYVGQKHRRKIELDDNSVTFIDEMIGAKSARSYLHVSNNFVIKDDYSIITREGEKVCKIEPINCTVEVYEDGMYAPEFGTVYNCDYIVFLYDKDSQKHGYRILY